MSSPPKLIRKIEQLEVYDQKAVAALVRICLPLFDVDFDLLRHALTSYCHRHQVDTTKLFSYCRDGAHIYNLDGKPVDYLPSDHPLFILWHKAEPIDPRRRFVSVFNCPWCGKPVTHTNQRNFPLLKNDVVLIGCPTAKVGTTVWAQPFGFLFLDSLPIK